MNFKHLVLLVGASFMVSCASAPKQQTQSASKKQGVAQAHHSSMALERMDAQFLYLASQDALAERQPALAARFLEALVKQKPDEIVPRFELVDLLLLSGQKEQAIKAKQYMAGMSQQVVSGLGDDDVLAYQQLYARTLIANDEIKPAAELLERLLQKQPKRMDVRLLLVRLYMINKDYKHAEDVLNQGLKLNKDIRLQELQVQLSLQQGKLSQADKLLAAMQKDYPHHENIVLQRSQLAEKKGDIAKAERLLKNYIAKQGEQAVQSLSALASLYVRHEKLKNAVKAYQQLLPLTDYSATVYMSLGKVYYQMAAFDQASKAFANAVKQLEPLPSQDDVADAQATAYFYWGASLEASKRAQDAADKYNKLQPKHMFYAEAQLRLANIEIRNKAFKAAEQRLKSLLKADQKNLDAYELLSSMRLQQKKYQALIEETEPALHVGFSSSVLFNRAVAFESLKRFEDLDKSLDELLKQEPDSADALNFYGYSLADRGTRLDDAKIMIDKALKMKPDDGYYLDSLAWVYFKQGQFNKAVKTQTKAVQEVPSDPVMQEHLGDMYWKAGYPEKARKHWSKALELNHDEPKLLQQKIDRGLI